MTQATESLAHVEYDGTMFGTVRADLADLCVTNGIKAGIRSIRVTIDGTTTEHLTERRTTTSTVQHSPERRAQRAQLLSDLRAERLAGNIPFVSSIR